MESFLKLGIEIGQTSVAKYMATEEGPSSQDGSAIMRMYCRNGPLRRADNLVSTAL
jgi:hypothetical protein